MRYNLGKWYQLGGEWRALGGLLHHFTKASRFIMSLVSIYSSYRLYLKGDPLDMSKSRQLHFTFSILPFVPICAFTTSFAWLMTHEIDPVSKFSNLLKG